mgnify:CR=1 FL=1
MVEAQLMGNLKDGREVYEACAPLDAQILALKDKGIKAPYLATPEEIALIRLDGVHTKWSRISYAPAKVKDKPTIVTADSPYMNEAMARVAMEAHGLGEYPSLPDVFYEALENIAKRQSSLAPEDRNVHVIEGKPKADGVIILTPEMDDTKFLLKGLAKEYFERFNHNSVPFYDLPSDVPKGKTNVNYLWFGEPQYGSVLDAGVRGLHDGNRASGVLDKSAKGASQKTKSYNTTNVRDSVRTSVPELCSQTGLTGVEKIIASLAEQIILRNLKRRR